MSKIIQLHHKNTTNLVFNTYKSSSDTILISHFLKLCKSKNIIPVLSNQDLISLPDLIPILNKNSNYSLTLQEFEKVLTDISNSSFPALTPNERYSKILQKLTNKTRTLSGPEINLKSALALTRKLQVSNSSNLSQRSLSKKDSLKVTPTESALKVHKQTSSTIDSSLKTHKSLEKIKHSRTSSFNAKIPKPQPISKIEKARKVLKNVKNFNFRQADPCVKNSVKYIEKQRKKLFSCSFLLKLILRVWLNYAKNRRYKIK